MKFSKLILGIFVLLIFNACQSVEEGKTPDNLISENDMVEILTELSILNSAKNYNRRLLEEKGLHPQEYLFEKYNIDSLQLAESTAYYAERNPILEQIYLKVKTNLDEMKIELDELKEIEDKREDSIRKLAIERDSLSIDSLQGRRIRSDSLVRPANRDLGEEDQ